MPHSTPTPSSNRDAGRIVAIVAGTIVALLALGSLAVGGIAIGVHSTQRDADGYYTSSSETLATPTYALVADKLEVGTDPAWLFRKGRLGTIRVAATGTRDKPVFVGIARKSQVESYLGNVRHDTISDFELAPLTVTYGHERGTAAPTAPGAQRFWASKSTGSGQQTLSWPVQKGDWAVVVMNADGSPGIHADVKVGAKVGFLLWAGIGLLALGALLAALAAVLFFWSDHAGPKPAVAGAPAAVTI
jgi:hypothetical protein